MSGTVIIKPRGINKDLGFSYGPRISQESIADDGESETPQETIARVMKFRLYTGSRPDWQFLLQKAVNDVDMLKVDRYGLMRATGKLLGYNLTPEPSNMGLDRWLAQQLANETGQSVIMIGGSATVEPSTPEFQTQE